MTECQESIAGFGSVGVRVQLEPCGDPAVAQMTYQFGGTTWEPAGRIEADGAPLLFAIPGAALLGAGLYISVTVTGNVADLSVHARLSACLNDVCDGAVSFVGSGLTAAGFPFPLLEFDDLAFVDSCPTDSSSSTATVVAAAVAVVALIVGAFAWIRYRNQRGRQAANRDVEIMKAAPVSSTVSATASNPASV